MPFTSETARAAGSKPKKRDFITQHLIAELRAVNASTGVERVRELVTALVDKALTGDVAAAKEIFDRVEGKVPQVVQGDADNPIEHVVRAAGLGVDDKISRIVAGRAGDAQVTTH